MAEGAGYGIVSLPTEAGAHPRGAVSSASLTSRLGCTEVRVQSHRLPGGGSVELAAGRERIVVPLDSAAGAGLGGTIAVPAPGVGRVPADRDCRLEATRDAHLLVVSTPATAGATEPRSVALADATFGVPSTSAVATAHLTDTLGCAGLKLNARRLAPGQAVPLHTEGSQAEVFVPLADGGSMRLGDETVETPRGTVVRVAPSIPRSARHDGPDTATWLMFGAPPTGGPTDWDPGATILQGSDKTPTADSGGGEP